MRKYAKSEEFIGNLTPDQYRFTQKSGTERADTGEYLYNKDHKVYLDQVEALTS